MECRRNSRIKNSEPLKVEAKMKTLEAKPSNCGSNVRRKNLILKHEILSPECDLFKASTPRRLHFVLIARAIIRILFIRGLGIQYSVRNALTHETTIFYPLERIKSFYIFESPDGLKYVHFFSVKIYESDERPEKMLILFEVQFSFLFNFLLILIRKWDRQWNFLGEFIRNFEKLQRAENLA